MSETESRISEKGAWHIVSPITLFLSGVALCIAGVVFIGMSGASATEGDARWPMSIGGLGCVICGTMILIFRSGGSWFEEKDEKEESEDELPDEPEIAT